MRKTAAIPILIILALAMLTAPYFYQNITFLLSAESQGAIIEGHWDWVLLYAGLYSVFILFLLAPRRHGSWRKSSALYTAFVVALFAEMFGFPLTVFFLSSFVGLPPVSYGPAVAWHFTILGWSFDLLLTSLIAGLITFASAVLILSGWRQVFRSKEMVTGGLYRYTRHPQYLGILMIATAWLFAWPTLPIMLMWPVLVFAYYRLARSEEREMEGLFGEEYAEYRKRTPMIIPLL